MHGNDIHVALAQNNVSLPGGSRKIQSVEVPALVKNRSFRGIQVFRSPVPHHSAAEPDYPVIDILNGKNHPVPELVIHAMLFIHIAQSCLMNELLGIAFAAQILHQVIACLIGKAKTKLFDGFICQLTVS